MRFGYLSPVSGFSPTVSTLAQSQASGSPAHSGIWTLLLSLQIYILPSFCLMCKPFASATRNTLFFRGTQAVAHGCFCCSYFPDLSCPPCSGWEAPTHLSRITSPK